MLKFKPFVITRLFAFTIPTLLFIMVGCNQNTPELSTFDSAASDLKAITIADDVMEASGGLENWNRTRYVAWRWLDKRLNVWDKWTGDIRVASKISIVIMNLNTRKPVRRVGAVDVEARPRALSTERCNSSRVSGLTI